MSESENFPLVDQLNEAKSAPALAALLLRVPDALIISHGLELGAACESLGFEAGKIFVICRSVALHAVRDAHGLLPGAEAARIEALRQGLSRLAAGET